MQTSGEKVYDDSSEKQEEIIKGVTSEPDGMVKEVQQFIPRAPFTSVTDLSNEEEEMKNGGQGTEEKSEQVVQQESQADKAVEISRQGSKSTSQPELPSSNMNQDGGMHDESEENWETEGSTQTTSTDSSEVEVQQDHVCMTTEGPHAVPHGECTADMQEPGKNSSSFWKHPLPSFPL